MPELGSVIAAAAGGILPALAWLWFWRREDSTHPEPRRLIALASALSDGSAVNWEAAESNATTDSERRQIRHHQRIEAECGESGDRHAQGLGGRAHRQQVCQNRERQPRALDKHLQILGHRLTLVIPWSGRHQRRKEFSRDHA